MKLLWNPKSLWNFFRRSSTPIRRNPQKPFKLYLEPLEDRLAPALVAILGAEPTASRLADVKNTIVSTGLFTSAQVDTYDVSSSTPNLTTLNKYSSVLVFSDVSFQDPTTLGNNLASYVNEGHGVVTSLFAFSSGASLSGTWAASGYSPFGVTGFIGGSASLGTIWQPGSPVMSGVTSFSGGNASFRGVVGLTSSATSLIAFWSDGTFLAAEQPGFAGKIIGLNFFPVSSNVNPGNYWNSATQGGLLMAKSWLLNIGYYTKIMESIQFRTQ